MALNKQVFKTRTISAAIFVVVMLSGLLWNHWAFLLLFAIIHTGCWVEYTKLVKKIYSTALHPFIQFGFILTGFGIMFAFCNYRAFQINGYGIRETVCIPLSFAGFLLLAIGIFSRTYPFSLKAMVAMMAGWLYISVSWGMMLGLRQHGMSFKGNILFFDSGRVVPLLLILSVWVNDTCAYLLGSFIGKTPFSKISPKKTWEGTLGGGILCVLVMGTAGSLLIMGRPSWLAVWVALLAASIGTIGDLLESKLKRTAGVKDSGSMLPGHGGFLDRFDSLLLSTPFVWLLMFILDKM